MTARRWLRAAAIVALLFALGHSLGGRRAWSPMGETAVLAAMRTTQFTVEGVSRSYFDFYEGFGISLSVLLLLQAVVLWQLSGRDTATIRPTIGAFALANAGIAVISWKYIFPVPAAFAFVLAVILGVTFFAAGRTSS